jgi:hypothetical protein
MKKPEFVKTLSLFLLVFTITFFSFSKEKTIASNWVAAPLSIDGSNEDWADVNFNFEKKVSVDYAFKNDAENLFVLFMFKDPKYLSSINATGMTIWFNTEGKKKQHYGLKFARQRVKADAFISILEQRRGTLSEEEKNKIRANPNYFLHNAQVINKKSKSSSQAPPSEGVIPAIFRAQKQKETIVYEFAIPLKRATELAPGIGTEPGKTVKVCFEWGGMTKEMKEARMKRLARASESRPPTSNRAGGSWSKGSSYGSSMPRVGQGAKKYSFWVDVQLALNQ